MAVNKSNVVKMVGPKGKISYVSRKASQSKHLSNLGFMIAHDQPVAATNTSKADAGKA
jgi:hypothetical protein